MHFCMSLRKKGDIKGQLYCIVLYAVCGHTEFELIMLAGKNINYTVRAQYDLDSDPGCFPLRINEKFDISVKSFLKV